MDRRSTQFIDFREGKDNTKEGSVWELRLCCSNSSKLVAMAAIATPPRACCAASTPLNHIKFSSCTTRSAQFQHTPHSLRSSSLRISSSSSRLTSAEEETQYGIRRRGGLVTRAKGKGFGELLQKKRKGFGDGETVVDAEVEKPEEARPCPCGGREEGLTYGQCCGPYHGGVVEPDATTLMRARFCAYARSKVDYVVRTTHPENPDFNGEKELAADVRATCDRLRFTKLEILESESTADDEAFVSFRVTYSLTKGGRGGDKKFLHEKSRFVKDHDRWLYRESIPLSQASSAAWIASTTPNYVDPAQARKSFSKSKPQANLSPRKS